jgi:predicted transcriptional regulator of viral defense system
MELRSAKGRQRLSKVLQRNPDLISVREAAATLGVPREEASKLLARWAAQGWLKRIRRGLYAPIPLAAASSEQVLADPWILVPRLFEPAYVGGWTATEHWGFTDQLFRSVCVFTGKPVRKADVTIQSIPFHLKHIPESARFGLAVVWRDNVRVAVSDRTKTIVDILDDPSAGGGIRHVALCLESYVRSEDFEPKRLLSYVEKRGNGAVFKRLGYLMERFDGLDAKLAAQFRRRLTKGNSKLDPSLPADKLVTRWRLWVPSGWAALRK